MAVDKGDLKELSGDSDLLDDDDEGGMEYSGEDKDDSDDKDDDTPKTFDEIDEKEFDDDDEDETELSDEDDEDVDTVDKTDEDVDKDDEDVDKDDADADPSDDDKLKADLIKHVIGEDGKGSTKYVVKGQELDLRDLTPEEIKQRFSQAGGWQKGMEDNATERKQIQKDRETLDRGAEQVNELMQRYGDIAKAESKGKVTTPEFLKPTEFDSDETKAVKEFAAKQHQDIESLKKSNEAATFSQAENAIIREIEHNQKEYTCGSPEEVIAIMSQNPNISIRDAMEASHKHYSGDAYFEKIKAARPDLVRAMKEEGIREHLARKNQTTRTKVPRRRSSSTASTKVSTGKKAKVPTTFDEIEAQHENIKSMINQAYDDDE